jgi:hypothetical protein
MTFVTTRVFNFQHINKHVGPLRKCGCIWKFKKCLMSQPQRDVSSGRDEEVAGLMHDSILKGSRQIHVYLQTRIQYILKRNGNFNKMPLYVDLITERDLKVTYWHERGWGYNLYLLPLCSVHYMQSAVCILTTGCLLQFHRPVGRTVGSSR